MAKVVVFTPDLLFGSSVVGALSAAGHSCVMCSDREALAAEGRGAAAVIVDLTEAAAERAGVIAELRQEGPLAGVPALGYYSHVDPDSRDRAVAAGIERVVPRSRMHREPAALVDVLLSGD